MALRFRIGPVPIEVAPSFLVATLVLNFGLAESDPRLLVLWAAVVFASVLVHELGHAGMGLAYGLSPRIDLHGLGGTTSWGATGVLVSWPRRVAISLAGPAAGMAAGGAVLGLGAAGIFPQLTWPRVPDVGDVLLGRVESGTLGETAFTWLLLVNFGWGLLNLLPMLPLDGGNALLGALQGLTRGRGERPARWVSLACAVLAFVASAIARQPWPALLAAWFLTMNAQALRRLAARERDERAGRSG